MELSSGESQIAASAAPGDVVAPFGFLGLCVSLLGIAALAGAITIVLVVTMAAIALPVLGRTALVELFDALSDMESGTGLRLILVFVLIFHFAIAAAIVFAAKGKGKNHWRDLIGWQPFRLADKMLWAIMAATFLYSAAADTALGHFLPHPAAQLSIPTDRTASALLLALAVVAAPIAEEFLFRGWVYTSLRFHWGLWPALLASSALFAFAHYEGTHLYALAVFPIGLALGAIRERSGSIKLSIAYHAFNNFAAFCLSALSGN
jgi:uncharacterized protein